MNPSSDKQAARSNFSTVIAAGIVAAGLVGAALIVAHKPTTTATVSAKPATAPPITQELARDQFRAQVLASPKLHTWTYRKIVYTLQDIQIKPDDVSYSAKDDTFSISYRLVVQPPLPADISSDGATDMDNDGYNHYSGLFRVDPADSQQGIAFLASDTVTIK